MARSVIVSAVRTPFGRLGGGLAGLPATELGAIAIRAALERSGLAPDEVEYAVMGQVLQAREAKELGLVAELMPREKLLPRAWEIAAQLARKPDMLLRYARAVLTHPLRKALEDGMPYYLAMETLSTLTKRGN